MTAPPSVAAPADSASTKAPIATSPPAATKSRLLLATEDDFGPPPVTTLDTIEVTSDRLGIAAIVDRCIRREEETAARILSHEYTEWTKTVCSIEQRDGEPKKELTYEEVRRVTLRRPDVRKTATLSKKEYEVVDGVSKERDVEAKDKDGASVTMKIEDFDDLPFYLEDRSGYDFKIERREIVGGRVIYQVSLAPKSDFEVAPHGRIWVDTSNFQIVREEFNFGDRVPMPMFVKSVGPVVREREPIGDIWVTSRLLVRLELRIGWMRFLDDEIPDRVDLVSTFRDQRVETKP